MNMIEIKCGFAARDITPDIGIVMDGFASREGPSTGILDNLYVRAVIFVRQFVSFVLVSYDSIGLPEPIYNTISEKISRCFNIPVSSILLAATHTHSAPAAGILKDIPIDRNYWDQVGEATINAVKEAIKCARPAQFDVNVGEITFPINRREKTDNGIVLGENSEAYTDRMVRVVRVIDEKSELLGVIVHASCHPLTLPGSNREISADFPGRFCKEISDAYPDLTVLFLNGSAGDVSPRKYMGEKPHDVLKRASNELANVVLKLLQKDFIGLKPRAEIMKSTKHYINVPIEDLPARDILINKVQDLNAKLLNTETEVQKYILTRYFNWYSDAVKRKDENTGSQYVDVPIQAFMPVEGILFLALPFEVFSSTGAELVDYLCSIGFDKNSVFVCSYSNGVYGYLVPAYALSEGGYEPDESYLWYDLPGRYAADAEKFVRKQCLNMVVEILN